MTTAPSQYVFDVVLNEPELMLIAEDLAKANPAWPAAVTKTKRLLALMVLGIIGCVALFIAGMIRVVEGYPNSSRGEFMLALGGSMAGWLAYESQRRWRAISASGLRDYAANWSQLVIRSIPDRRFRLCIDAEQISVQSPRTTMSIRWSMISEIQSVPSALLIVSSRGGMEALLPSSMIPAAQRLTLEQDLRAWLAANGGGDEERISRYLVARDLDCPGCKYNLRGTRSGACPECGSKLNATTLPQAFPERKG